ncbi:protein of unknown function DUF336 [Thioalkalivibrio nitratireducens DSM 14787]|uniref:Extracellular protein n=1 Tax=Thioalkalivibrio nitratireducens (strain DSM 14787 / UNIQEM 213 / ALEN2) TaxID=1255043 RepID=L0E027_THIND|nr:heme-binding protein [Thioalkalivibrio nitratireducens]AGA35199.1 protein of unknown function DUF336 [Thioalkalivibrio nitratireducens DSM 14787]
MQILRGFVLLGAVTALFPMAPVTAEEEFPLAINVRQMHMETALTAARAAMAACRAEGIQVGVTVVDRRGTEQVVLRDVVAPHLTLAVSRMKAYTANEMSVATSALEEDGPDSPLAHVPGLFLGAGGVPIEAGGVYYGAIGVSGASTGIQDEACARAGAEAVEIELEMSL